MGCEDAPWCTAQVRLALVAKIGHDAGMETTMNTTETTKTVDDATFAVLDLAAECVEAMDKRLPPPVSYRMARMWDRGLVRLSTDHSWWQLTDKGVALYRAGKAERGMR
jgi:hypothetical protein